MSWLPHCTGGIMVTKKKKTAIEALVLDNDAVQKLKGQTSSKHVQCRAILGQKIGHTH